MGLGRGGSLTGLEYIYTNPTEVGRQDVSSLLENKDLEIVEASQIALSVRAELASLPDVEVIHATEVKIRELVEEGNPPTVLALREAFDRWSRHIWPVLLTHTQKHVDLNGENAKDLAQTALMKLWELLLDQMADSLAPEKLRYQPGTSLVALLLTLLGRPGKQKKSGLAGNERAKQRRHQQILEGFRTGVLRPKATGFSARAKSPSEPIFALQERYIRTTPSPYSHMSTDRDAQQHDVLQQVEQTLATLSPELRLLYWLAHRHPPHSPQELEELAQAMGCEAALARAYMKEFKNVLYDRGQQGQSRNKPLTQNELGDLYGVSRQTIYQWLKKIAGALNRGVDKGF